MAGIIQRETAAIGLGITIWFTPYPSDAAEPGEVRTRAEQSFQQLPQQSDPQGPAHSTAGTPSPSDDRHSNYPSHRYWVGNGQGDLSKGKIVCQRVAELSARTDLAKQIRVMVKEHMIDRVRERTGRDSEQDIELTREEIVQEYLSGVTIVDRRIDEDNKICTATAVMLKSPLQPKQPVDLEAAPPSSR